MTTPTMLTIIFGGLAALGGLGGLATILVVRDQRGKLKAEARHIGVNSEDVVSGRALDMYDRTLAEAREAKVEARECRQRLAALEDHVDHLERLMRDAGLDPPPFRWPRLDLAEGGES